MANNKMNVEVSLVAIFGKLSGSNSGWYTVCSTNAPNVQSRGLPPVESANPILQMEFELEL